MTKTVRCDARFLLVKFKADDNVMYEEFHYHNTCKLIGALDEGPVRAKIGR